MARILKRPQMSVDVYCPLRLARCIGRAAGRSSFAAGQAKGYRPGSSAVRDLGVPEPV